MKHRHVRTYVACRGWQLCACEMVRTCRDDTNTEAVLSPVDTAAKLLHAPVSIQDKIKCEGEWLH